MEEMYNNKHVQKLVDSGKIDPNKIQFLDTYNQIVRDDVAGTISTRVDASNETYVTEPKSCASRKRGDEHKIETRNDEVANCVTSINTDSRVQETIIYDGLNNRIPKEQDIMGTVVPQFSRFGKTNGYKIIEKMEEPLKIPQATKQGYIDCPVGGVFDASYPNSELRRGRVQENGDVSPALTTSSESAILRYEGVEPQVLTPLRTEEGRQLRKQGIDKFGNRALYPREDGCSNTITTLTKDNYLQEPNGIEYKGKHIKEGDGLYTDTTQEFFRGGLDGVSRTLKAKTHDAGTCVMQGARYRIRKLTPIEVGRLMNVDDTDIQKMIDAGISKTGLYKLFGNSIVVNVLYHIFRKMFIETKCEDQQLSLFDFDD